MSDDGRRRHYGGFYGIDELPSTGRPRVLVWGNCQAEALRVCLDSSGAVDSVRLPPVHELEQGELADLERILEWADVVLAQAVATGYRGLPLGTDDIAGRLREQAQVLPIPNYFSTALYPEQVVVHAEGVTDPPLVPYHDVRRLGRAAGWDGPWEPSPEHVRENAGRTHAELARREQEQGSIVVSDVLPSLGAEEGWTINHPGNGVLVTIAQRALDGLTHDGVVDPVDGRPPQVQEPDRMLLSSVVTPLAPVVVKALGLHAEPRADWLVGGRTVSDEEVGAVHEEWYAEHPRAVEAGIEKRGAVLRELGWSPR